MARKVTFIHAADVHLGAPFRGLRALAPAWAEVLLRCIPEAFERMIDAAIEEAVDFVVLAGDTFDNSHPSYADYALFMRGMARLGEAGIPVYMVTGNHDPYASWRSEYAALPGNVRLLGADGPGFSLFKRDGKPLALIAGRGYRNQAWPAGEDVSAGISRETAEAAVGASAPFAVGILHTGLDVDPTRSPVSPAELLRRNMDYWACGHIHQPRVLPNRENPRIAFSGSPQARDAKETGPHGVFKVTLEEGKPNRAEFIHTAQVEWQRLSIDISECATVAEVQERIIGGEFSRNAQSNCKRMMFRISLTGRNALYRTLTPAALEDLRTVLNDGYPFFFVDDISNAVAPPIDVEALRCEGLFPSAFLDEMDSVREQRAAALSTVEGGFRERGLSMPASLERVFPQICDDAEGMVLDLLGRDA